MTPFQSAGQPPGYSDPLALRKLLEISTEEAHRMAAANRRHKFFLNDRYQVCTREIEWPGVGAMVHLSIKRLDKEAIHDWRDLQAIKNELVGAECEAIELYPAESRLVDAANQFHLWAFIDPTVRVPIGWTQREVGGAEEAAKIGAKQRPFA